MAYLTIKEYSIFNNINTQKIYRLIKNKKIETVFIDKVKHIKVNEDEIASMFTKEKDSNNTTQNNKTQNNTNNDAVTLKLIEALTQKDETIKDIVEDNRRVVNAVLNRLDEENNQTQKSNTHLKLNQRKL